MHTRDEVEDGGQMSGVCVDRVRVIVVRQNAARLHVNCGSAGHLPSVWRRE